VAGFHLPGSPASGEAGKDINRTVAWELAAVERSKILRGEAGIGGKKRKDISFEKAGEEFLKWAEANKRPGTVQFYRYCLKGLEGSFAGKKLSEIAPFLIEKHKQKRLAAGFKVAGNRELASLSTLFNRCQDWGKFEGKNPVRSVKRIDEPQNRVRFLTEEEERLLKAASEPLGTILLVGIYAGLRVKAEALTLKWDNVDLDRKVLTIEALYAKNKETETIPLHSKLFDALKAMQAQQQGDYVFSRPDGARLRSIRTAFTLACQRAKLRDVTPHTLRHTFASRLGMAGVNDVTLQRLGRWKEPKMIRRYAHLSQEHLADAIEKIGSHSTTLFTTAKAASS
jgi:integrase